MPEIDLDLKVSLVSGGSELPVVTKMLVPPVRKIAQSKKWQPNLVSKSGTQQTRMPMSPIESDMTEHLPHTIATTSIPTSIDLRIASI